MLYNMKKHLQHGSTGHKNYEPTTNEHAVDVEFVFAVTLNIVLLSFILDPKYVYTFFTSFVEYVYAASVELMQ